MTIITRQISSTLKTKKLNSSIDLDQAKSGSIGSVNELFVNQVGIVGPRGDIGPVGPKGDIGPVGPIGLNWKGSYDPVVEYLYRDVVKYNGSTYICLSETAIIGVLPTVEGYWDILSVKGQDGDKYYEHQQLIESNVWNINHNLGKVPIVNIFDFNGNILETDIKIIDINTIQLKCKPAASGIAYLN